MVQQRLEPIGDRVVVQRARTEAKSAGGIYFPDGSHPTPRIGTVVAVGPGALRLLSPTDASEAHEVRLPMQCKVGDRVLLPGGAEIVLLDPADKTSEVVVCPESQLLAIFR